MQDFPFFDRPLRVSFAKSVSNAVATKKGGKAAKGKPPKAPAAAAGGDAAAAKAKQPADAAGAGKAAAAVDVGTPNPKLFIENLPSATTAAMLEMLFQQFPGCKEVTMVEAKPGIAFVEFEKEMQATVALTGLQGFKITPQNAMRITYSK